MSADFDILINSVRARLPSALDGVVRLELQNVIKDFLSESNLYVDTIPINVVVGQTDYPIFSINGVINRLMTVADSYNNPVPSSLVPPTLTVQDFVVRLAIKPSTAATFNAYVALTPDPSVPVDQSIPDWVIAKYREGFEDGILARMMTQPAKPYSNMKLADYHGRKYRKAINLARNEALHAYKFRGQGWGFPQGFVRSGQYQRI